MLYYLVAARLSQKQHKMGKNSDVNKYFVANLSAIKAEPQHKCPSNKSANVLDHFVIAQILLMLCSAFITSRAK